MKANRQPQTSRRLLALSPGMGMLRLAACLVVLWGVTSAQTHDDVNQVYQNAWDSGYRAGLEHGRRDHSESKGFDVERHKVYKNADQGSEPDSPHIDVYRSAFRRGFEAGYKEAFGLAKDEKERPPRPRPIPPASMVKIPERIDEGPMTVIPFGTHIRLMLLETLSTRSNERGDVFSTRVLQEVEVDGRIAIPKGTVINGWVVYLKRAGRIKGKAEMKLRFGQLLFDGNQPVQLSASLIEIGRYVADDEEGTVKGESSKGRDGKTVGTTAAIGTLIGLISGGKRGGAIGAGAGAVIGLGGVLAGRGKDLNIESRTELLIRLDRQAKLPLLTVLTED